MLRREPIRCFSCLHRSSRRLKETFRGAFLGRFVSVLCISSSVSNYFFAVPTLVAAPWWACLWCDYYDAFFLLFSCESRVCLSSSPKTPSCVCVAHGHERPRHERKSTSGRNSMFIHALAHAPNSSPGSPTGTIPCDVLCCTSEERRF